MSAERITWSKYGQRASEAGRVNGAALFRIDFSVRRGVGYVLRTDLPVKIEEGMDTDRNRDVLKHRAELLLEQFVQKLGASFPE